ncbi:hypothetical protein DdX_16680 [Ditylenchus destructor]|uniref:F-box domain-containing protein n=1 Tax=Ditylenchus destructor TaxID=166010 RepID=A0AAD4MMN5_9BILA|nr:hypothetical protein DdX_16680 [Ditylenchus destructor]
MDSIPSDIRLDCFKFLNRKSLDALHLTNRSLSDQIGDQKHRSGMLRQKYHFRGLYMAYSEDDRMDNRMYESGCVPFSGQKFVRVPNFQELRVPPFFYLRQQRNGKCCRNFMTPSGKNCCQELIDWCQNGRTSFTTFEAKRCRGHNKQVVLWLEAIGNRNVPKLIGICINDQITKYNAELLVHFFAFLNGIHFDRIQFDVPLNFDLISQIRLLMKKLFSHSEYQLDCKVFVPYVRGKFSQTDHLLRGSHLVTKSFGKTYFNLTQRRTTKEDDELISRCVMKNVFDTVLKGREFFSSSISFQVTKAALNQYVHDDVVKVSHKQECLVLDILLYSDPTLMKDSARNL